MFIVLGKNYWVAVGSDYLGQRMCYLFKGKCEPRRTTHYYQGSTFYNWSGTLCTKGYLADKACKGLKIGELKQVDVIE